MNVSEKWPLTAGFGQRRDWLQRLAASGRLDGAHWHPALRALGLVPSTGGWVRLLFGTFVASGFALLAAALIFAVAFNWDALGHFSRFAMVQAVLLLFVLLAWWRGVDSASGEAALFAAGLATGALLALFGQTYQTGADPYSLFVVWALLLLPWTLHACRASFWLLWVLIVNTAVWLYSSQVPGEMAWLRLFGNVEVHAALTLAVNGVLLILFESVPALGAAALARVLPRVLTVIVLAAVAVALIPMIGWRSHPDVSAVHQAGVALLSLGAFAAIAWWYLQRRLDVPVLTAAALCAVSIGYALLVRVMLGSDPFGFFSLSAAYWIGSIAGAVMWLRGLAPPASAQDAHLAASGGHHQEAP